MTRDRLSTLDHDHLLLQPEVGRNPKAFFRREVAVGGGPEDDPLSQSGEGQDEVAEDPAGHVHAQGDSHREQDDALL